MRISLAGDSLSVGAGAALRALLAARGDTLDLAAKVGAPTSKIVEAARVVAPNVPVLCVMAGTNDIAGDAEPAWLAKSLVGSLAKMKREGLRIIVGSPPPLRPRLDEWRTYVATLNAECKAAGLEFAQIGAVVSLDELSDGVHPGPVGYKAMAEAWISAIDAKPSSNGIPWGTLALVGLGGIVVWKAAS